MLMWLMLVRIHWVAFSVFLRLTQMGKRMVGALRSLEEGISIITMISC